MKELKKASDGKRPELKLSIGYKDYRLPKDIDRIKLYLDRFEYYLNNVDWSPSCKIEKPSFLMNFLELDKIADVDNYEINNEEVSTGDTLGTQWLNSFFYGNQLSKLYAELTSYIMSKSGGMRFIIHEDSSLAEIGGEKSISISSDFMKNAFPTKFTIITIDKVALGENKEYNGVYYVKANFLFCINADVIIDNFNSIELEETLLYRFLLLNMLKKYITELTINDTSVDCVVKDVNIIGYEYEYIELDSNTSKEKKLSDFVVENYVTSLSSFIEDGKFSLNGLFNSIKSVLVSF